MKINYYIDVFECSRTHAPPDWRVVYFYKNKPIKNPAQELLLKVIRYEI